MPYVISNLGDYVTHRGRRWHLPRGQAVELPPAVAEIALRLPDTYLVREVQGEVLEVEGYDGPYADLLPEHPEDMSDEEIIAVEGIGPARLEEIRSHE